MPDQSYTDELEALKRDIAQLRADLARLTATLTEDAKSRGRQFRDAASENFEHLAASLKSSGNESIAAIEKRIEAHPITSLLIAAGVGYILGSLNRK